MSTGISLVQTQATVGNVLSNLTASLLVPTTRGNCVVAYLQVAPVDSLTPLVTNPTPGSGWLLAGFMSNPGGSAPRINVFIYYLPNCPAGLQSFNFDFAGVSCEAAIILEEWAGLDQLAPLDCMASNSTTTTAVTTGTTPPTSGAVDLVVWCMGYCNDPNILSYSSVLNGYADSLLNTAQAAGYPEAELAAFSQIVTGTGPQSSGCTLAALPNNGANTTGAVIACFRQAGSVSTIATPARVQDVGIGSNASVSSLTATLPNPPQAGNLLLACVCQPNNSVVTPPAGWTLAAQDNTSGTKQLAVYYLANLPPGGQQSYTFAQATAGSMAILLGEWSGCALSGVVDASDVEHGSVSTSPFAGPATTAQANELWHVWIGYIRANPTTFGAPPTGWLATATADSVNNLPGCHIAGYAEDVTTAGAASFAIAPGAALSWIAILVTFVAQIISTLAPTGGGGSAGGTIG